MTTAIAFSTPVRRRHSNELHITPIVKWVTVALFICISGLIFVYLKNQQHAIGSQTSAVEKQIAQTRSQNEVMLARISVLSSHAALQRQARPARDRAQGDRGQFHRTTDTTRAGRAG